VAEGDAEDINRAVTAARRAFEGPWSKFKPYERQEVLLKLADLVEKHFDEFCVLDTMDMGAPISRTTGGKRRVLGMLRYYASMAVQIHGETLKLPARRVLSCTLKEPVVSSAIIPWNGPLSARCGKSGQSGDWLHDGAETGGRSPAYPLTLWRTPRRLVSLTESSISSPAMGRRPGRHWRVIQMSIKWLYRLARGWTTDQPCVGNQSETGVARAWWQVT
jgi:hypothetical protein